MAVTVTSAVEGLTPGETYTGPNEAWLLENGYAAAIDEGDIPDLDHPDGAEYPDEGDYDGPLAHSSARYPEVAPETLIQNTRAEEAVNRARSTKPPYSSDPAPAEVPEAEPEPEDGPEEPPEDPAP